MKTYLLAAIEQAYSRLNRVPMWRLHWVDTETGELYETTTDATYENHHRWEPIIRAKQTGYYTGIKRSKRTTREGTPIISADSRPHLHRLATEQEVVLELTRMTTRSTYNDLFERCE